MSLEYEFSDVSSGKHTGSYKAVMSSQGVESQTHMQASSAATPVLEGLFFMHRKSKAAPDPCAESITDNVLVQRLKT